MADLIGPTFGRELAAAGLGGLPMSWSSDGTITFDPSMTADQINGVLAVYAAHDPTQTGVSTRQIEAGAVLGAGALIHCLSNTDLSTRWRLDDATMSQLGAISLGTLTGQGLPLNNFSFIYPAFDGHPVSMSAAEFQRLYVALRDFIAHCQLYAVGALPLLPVQPVEVE
jgi:hypothetical protein